MSEFIFLFFSLSSIFCSLMIVFNRNPIHSILFLTFVFLSICGLFLILNVEFIAMLFLVVYLGALIVLFLFVVMMLNIKILNLKDKIIKYIPIVFIMGIIFFFQILFIFIYTLSLETLYYYFSNSFIFDMPLFFVSNFFYNFSYTYFDYSNLFNYTNIEYISQFLYKELLYLFILSGFILLVAMIGSIILTLNPLNSNKSQFIFEQLKHNYYKSLKKWDYI